MKKTYAGIALIVIGACLLVFSNYIANQVTEGKFQIQSGQQTVDTAKSVFSISRYTKPIGDQLAKPWQKKIDAGKEEVSKYQELSHNLQMGGVALMILGVLILVFPLKRS